MNTPVLRSGLRSRELRSEEVRSDQNVVAEASRLPVGYVIANKYVIRGVLGEGGFAVVYDAEHLGLSCLMAIKVLHLTEDTREELILRFREEGRISATIHHPNVLAVHDTGTLEDGSPYLVMERVDGETLHARLRQGALTIRETMELARQLLSALCVLSELGIVHRDIKPENLMFHTCHHGDRMIKLVDFGISKVVRGGERTTLGKGLVGTPHYMSPEHLTGEEVDGRSDIYATGVVLYEALTGKLPHACETLSSLAFSVMMGRVTPVRSLRFDCPAELERVVLRAIEPDKQQRYQSARLMLQDVEACARALTEPSFLVDLSADPLPAYAEVRREHQTSQKTRTWDAPDVRVILRQKSLPRSARAALWVALSASSVLLTSLGFDVSGSEATSVQKSVKPSATTPAEATLAKLSEATARPSQLSVAQGQAPLPVVTSAAKPRLSEAEHASTPEGVRGRRRSVRETSQPGVEVSAERAPSSESRAPAKKEMRSEERRAGPSPSRHGLLDAALASYVRGRLKQALELYRSATSLDPKDAEAWRGVGVVSARLGRNADARSAFQRYLALAPKSEDVELIRQRLRELPPGTGATQ